MSRKVEGTIKLWEKAKEIMLVLGAKEETIKRNEEAIYSFLNEGRDDLALLLASHVFNFWVGVRNKELEKAAENWRLLGK